MYDALLAARGWGEQDFRLADPGFLSTVRWTLFAERTGPMLAKVDEAAADPPMDLDRETKRRLAAGRRAAKTRLRELEPLVVPEGD